MTRIEAFVFNAFQMNTYLVVDQDGNALVVDPGFYSEEERQQFDRHIAELGLTLAGQINTHCHVDHVLGVGYIHSTYGLPFSAHPDESALAQNAPFMGDIFGLKVEPLPGIGREVRDNEEITFGRITLRSIHVPGHSPGSLAFHDPEAGFVITGDALFRGSIGRSDLPGGDHDQLIRSIRERLMVLPPETVVYPGHGPSSTIGEEQRENPFLQVSE